MADIKNILDSSIAGVAPWHGLKGTGSKGEPPCPSSRYEGWTLVECADRWMWAVKGTERFRVCRAMTPIADAQKDFRKMVDKRTKKDQE